MNEHTRVWTLQEVTDRLEEVVRLAQSEGPQIVTVRGKEAVTISKAEQLERKITPGMSGLDAIKMFQVGLPFDFEIPEWETEGEFRDIEL